MIGSLHRWYQAVQFKEFLTKLDKEAPLHAQLVAGNYITHLTPAVKQSLLAHPWPILAPHPDEFVLGNLVYGGYASSCGSREAGTRLRALPSPSLSRLAAPHDLTRATQARLTVLQAPEPVAATAGSDPPGSIAPAPSRYDASDHTRLTDRRPVPVEHGPYSSTGAEDISAGSAPATKNDADT